MLKQASLAPWDLDMHLPWQVFMSPLEKWAAQPSFLIGEYLFYAVALTGLWHAWNQGEGRRRHLLAWVGALLAGTANDMFFMALPLVDNFWQAQATIMITPRLPLYIPCVYISFMYYATVSVWRLGLPQWSRAALTGLAAALFYGPYDVVGAKFSWWTWHDSDLPISNRLLGAPVGSTMWIIMFTATFAWFIGRAVDRDPAVAGKTFARGLLMACGLSTLTFMVQITAVQQIDGGIPGPIGLATVVLVYAAIVAVTAVALGALLECLSWARWLELLRLLGVGVAFALLPDWFGFQAPVALRGAVLVFAIGSAAWLLRRSTTAQQVPA